MAEMRIIVRYVLWMMPMKIWPICTFFALSEPSVSSYSLLTQGLLQKYHIDCFEIMSLWFPPRARKISQLTVGHNTCLKKWGFHSTQLLSTNVISKQTLHPPLRQTSLRFPILIASKSPETFSYGQLKTWSHVSSGFNWLNNQGKPIKWEVFPSVSSLPQPKQEDTSCYFVIREFFIKMRASYLQPSLLQYSSFLKEGGSKAGSSHFNEKFSF